MNPPIVRRWQKLAPALFILAYFLYFSWDSLSVHFAADDMMNMAGYWRLKPLDLLLSQFLLWRGFYRPMGALFYLPLLSAFGLNPVPYHVVLLAVLLANVCLVYRFARSLGCDELAAYLAALAVCYHAGLFNLQFSISVVFDIVCFFFYLGAFVYYARIRGQGRLLRGGEMAAFFGLYLCALNSKEMAVTLPLALLAYEWIYHKPARWRWKELAGWLRGPGRVAMIGALLNMVYIYGKAFGPNPLMKYAGYRLAFSRQRFLDFQEQSFTDLLYWPSRFEWRGVLVVWILLAYLAWRRRHPALRFCWILMVVLPLPIEFLQARRALSCLYLPLAAWAVFAAVVFVDMARGLAGFLAAEPLLRHLGRRGLLAAIVAGAVILWARETRDLKRLYVEPWMARDGEQTWEVIQQFRALDPRVRPGSQVVFLNDPFEDWDMMFIAELWFRDRTVSIRLQRKLPLSPEDLARVDYLFAFENGKLVQVR